jgi:acyl phosphate:glycerol-3-phosphate acyltransferase
MYELSAVALAYLLGSIPFAWLVSRRHGVDIRTVGSGNPGASNVLRSVGVAAGMAVLILDVAKGTLAVLIAQWMGVGLAMLVAAAVAAIVGHVYPLWFGFRGGKGVATAAGVFAVLLPVGLIVAVVVFLVTVAITRFVSVGSLLGAGALVIVALARGAPSAVIIGASIVMVIIINGHRANLARLIAGTEPRLGQRVAADVVR